MQPAEWNVVVTGHWNLAILTPGRVGRKVFGLPEQTPIEVLVQLDNPSPYQVRHNKVIAVPGSNQLILQTMEHTSECLQYAIDCSKRAVEALPETPLSACGINFRYQSEACPTNLAALISCESETIVSDLGRRIVGRRRGESLEYGDGRLNVIIDVATEGATEITFNFERAGPMVHIAEWLSQDIEPMQTLVASIMEKYDE